jgi:hypothetical protein
MPGLETNQDALSRNRNGTMVVAMGLIVALAAMFDDGAKVATWYDIVTPHNVFGMLGHAASVALIYFGAKRQDP